MILNTKSFPICIIENEAHRTSSLRRICGVCVVSVVGEFVCVIGWRKPGVCGVFLRGEFLGSIKCIRCNDFQRWWIFFHKVVICYKMVSFQNGGFCKVWWIYEVNIIEIHQRAVIRIMYYVTTEDCNICG